MQIFFKTDIGNYRLSNQDDCKVGAFTDDEVWAVVCDGMGGHNGGNIASAMATSEIEKVITTGCEIEGDTEEESYSSIMILLHSLIAFTPLILQLFKMTSLEYHSGARHFSPISVSSIMSLVLCQNGYLKLKKQDSTLTAEDSLSALSPSAGPSILQFLRSRFSLP